MQTFSRPSTVESGDTSVGESASCSKPHGGGVGGLFTPEQAPRKRMKKTLQLPPVRVSEEDYNRFAIAASNADRSLSDWMRRTLLNGIDAHPSTMGFEGIEINEDDA